MVGPLLQNQNEKCKNTTHLSFYLKYHIYIIILQWLIENFGFFIFSPAEKRQRLANLTIELQISSN